jgi:hypothetical protein
MSEVKKLMDEIARLPVKPDIFKVGLIAASYQTGYIAYVIFRDNYSNLTNLGNLETHADTPEEALRSLKKNLTDLLGPCPHCGRTGPKEETNA